MNDFQICKRIAEIEGVVHAVSRSMLNEFKVVIPLTDEREPQKDYNPLTDDALCFQLMNKYKVSVDHEDGMCGVLVKVSQTNHWEYLGNICYDKDVTINKAICLAIIEAHKDD